MALAPRVSRRSGPTTVVVRYQATTTANPRAAIVMSEHRPSRRVRLVARARDGPAGQLEMPVADHGRQGDGAAQQGIRLLVILHQRVPFGRHGDHVICRAAVCLQFRLERLCELPFVCRPEHVEEIRHGAIDDRALVGQHRRPALVAGEDEQHARRLPARARLRACAVTAVTASLSRTVSVTTPLSRDSAASVQTLAVTVVATNKQRRDPEPKTQAQTFHVRRLGQAKSLALALQRRRVDAEQAGGCFERRRLGDHARNVLALKGGEGDRRTNPHRLVELAVSIERRRRIQAEIDGREHVPAGRG